MPEKSSRKSKSMVKTWLDNFLASRPLLFRVVGRIVRPDEIEDIVQETFLHTFAASRKQHIKNPRAFMVTTAKNIALNYIKRSDRKLNCSIEELTGSECLIQPDLVEKQYQSEEQFLVFCRAVAELPVKCRRVFILKKVYGLSQKEISSYLKISPSTVENHITKGMTKTVIYMRNKGYLEGNQDFTRDVKVEDEVHN